MAATIAQQPKVLGRGAVEQAVKAAKGEQVQQVIDVEEGRDQAETSRRSSDGEVDVMQRLT